VRLNSLLGRPGRPVPRAPRRPLTRRFVPSLKTLEDRVAPALGTFELDGNATTQATNDWDQVYNDVVQNPGDNTSGSIPGAAVFIRDRSNVGNDNIFTQGSSDEDDLNAWRLSTGRPQPKNDIANVYALASEVQVGADTHTVVNFGADRISNAGEAAMGFWFFQNEIGVSPNGTRIVGAHEVGDILVQINFSSSVASFQVFRWVGAGVPGGPLQPITLDPDDHFAIVNDASLPTGGWPFQDVVNSPANTFAPGEFVEAGLDLTALGLPTHLNTFLVSTRASTSVTANLSDVVIGRFPTFDADVAVTKTVDDPTPNVGQDVTFTVRVTNNGPNAATNVVVHDPLPAGLEFVSATPSQGSYDPDTGNWTVGDLDPRQSATLEITVTVISPDPQINVATATRDQDDPDPNNDKDFAEVVPQQSDLHLTKTVNHPRPNVGQNVTFTLLLTNRGPDRATNVTVNDVLPAGLTFISETSTPGSYDHNTGVWTVGNLASGATARLTITARVDFPQPTKNVSTADADQFDPDTDDNTASVDVEPLEADLAVTKIVDDATPSVGDIVTYTIILSNLGPDTATNIRLHDTLPPGVTIISASATAGTVNVPARIWAVPSLAALSQATLTIRVRVTSPTATPNVITITDADQFDPNTNNNESAAEVNPPDADLSMTKTVANATPNVGDTITFTLTLRNLGPDPATGTEVSDRLPAGLTFVSASDPAYDPDTGIWTVGTLDPQAEATLVITARVDSPATGVNVATASAIQFDPDLTNNADDVGFTPQQADLAVEKTVSDETPNVGDPITYTITLTNNGPDTATNVTVHDLLPAGLTLVSADPSQGAYDASTGTWTVGTLAATASATLTFQTIFTAEVPQTNVVTITHSDQFDPRSDNNHDQATVSPAAISDLAVTKMASPRQATVGSLVTFTITVRNLGPETATDVLVADRLPPGLAFVSARASAGVYHPATGQWNIVALAPNGFATLRITARVLAARMLTNIARVSFPGIDSDPTNDEDSASVLGVQPAASKRQLLGSTF